jgi:predicted nucleotidyltransferase component of viral defense system
MGKIAFTPLQKTIFDAFITSEFSRGFYFTGGTALSVFHLGHRYSEDLDFFSEEDFDTAQIQKFVSQLGKKLDMPYKFTKRYDVRIVEFEKRGKLLIKLDFNWYPYKRIEKGLLYRNFPIDGLRDIATNKLTCVRDRTEAKDFVDLYYLLRKFTLWDLFYGAEAKFHMEMDLILTASDFLKVDRFETLPRMIKPLTLTTLKTFFRNQAKEIGKRVTTR